LAENIIYKDNLTEISNDSILIKNYYFPIIGSKRVLFKNIESVTAEQPSLSNGKFRIWGTRNFATWYPMDFFRSRRDKIFIINLVGKTISVGLTVKSSEAVFQIFEKNGLMKHATA
jgi:hypothetical protein